MADTSRLREEATKDERGGHRHLGRPFAADDTLAGLADVDVDDGAVILIPMALSRRRAGRGGCRPAAPALAWREVALDAARVAGPIRRLRRLEPRSWLATVVRRTWLPMLAVAVLLGTGGYVIADGRTRGGFRR